MKIFDLAGALGVCLALASPAASAAGSGSVDDAADSRLTVLGDQTAADAPTILRGSAVPRKAPKPEPVMGPGRWQFLSGRRLWVTDPATREVFACNLYQTTEVGQRVVRCFEGDLPRDITRD